MKKIATLALSFLACFVASAQKFDYNVDFDYLLNNYEYGISRYFVDEEAYYPYQHSHTVHGARLTPEIGLLLPQSKYVYHRLRLGIDVFKQMGQQEENLGLLKEVILYYNLEANLPGGGHLDAYAGCFPRRFSEGKGYLGFIYDREYAYLDPNLEGFLVKYSRGDRIRAELILDWQGMIGDDNDPWRRERFNALTDGSWRFAGDLYFGWTGSFYHYAKSPMCDNVVDRHTLNPRIEWAPFTWMDDFRLELGGLFTYQCDRETDPDPVFPMGLWSRQSVSKWNVTVSNSFYWGDDLMPFYDSSFSGQPYGRDLYQGEPSFHTLHDTPSWADWFTVTYQPKLTRWLSLDVAFTLHLGQPHEILKVGAFRGSEQRIGLRLDLEALRPHPKAAPRKNKSKQKDPQGISL